MSTSDSDSVNEFECQSCGQLPICLNSTANGHEVCDDCLPLFAEDENLACPLPVCEIPSHMTDKISAIQEDLEKCSDKKTIEEISSINQHVEELKDVETEVGVDPENRNDLRTKLAGLTIKVDVLEQKSADLQRKSNKQLRDFQRLKKNLMKENAELRKCLKNIKMELRQFGSSTKLNEDELEDHSLSLDGFNLLTQNDRFKPTFSWQIKNIQKKMERATYDQLSESFEWPGHPVTARAKLELEGNGEVQLSMRFEHSDRAFTREVKLPPNVYFLLKNGNSPKMTTRGKSCFFPKNLDLKRSYLPASAHKTCFIGQSDIGNDSVTVEVHVESPSMARRVHSRDGVLNWVLKDCEKRRLMEEKNLVNFQESPYFYTGPNGYRVQVLLELNGGLCHGSEVKGPCVTVNFIPGEHDKDLPRVFLHRTTVTASNPKDPERCVVKTFDRNLLHYSHVVNLCGADQLSHLIQDDTLYLRVEIVKTTL